MLQRIWSLVIKELLIVWKNPKTRIMLVLPPIVQLLIFTFAATLDVKNVSIGVLNRDNGKEAFELVERFKGSPTFTRISHLSAVEEIAPFIDNQRGIMVVSIDETFSRKLNQNQTAEVQIICDGRKSNAAQIVFGYANDILARFNADFCKTASIPQENAQLFIRNWYNPNLLYFWYNVPCLVATLAMITCLIVTSSSVSKEREFGTFDQLLVSPLLPVEILAGKIIPGLIIGLIEGSIILLVGIAIFQVPFTGSWLLFYFSLFVFVLSISGVGLFISSFCATQQQAILGTFVFITPSVLLAGFATPIENMPEWLQPTTYLIPLRYMLVISKGLFLKAMPPSIVLKQIWPMAVIALFNLIGASLFFRRRLG